MEITKNKRRARIVIAALMLTMAAWLLPGTPAALKAYGAESPADPRITADSVVRNKQVVTWDCVYFGSYPQKEVIADEAAYGSIYKGNYFRGYYDKDNDIIEDAALYSTLQSAEDWDSNGDITVNGSRYRRIKGSDSTSPSVNGLDSKYNWKDKNVYRYFKYEPVKWRVLKVDGSDALLLADRAVDDKRYNEAVDDWITADVTWRNSTIRSWLNGYDADANRNGNDYSSRNFIDAAFTEDEQSAIKSTDVDNGDSSTESSESSSDKVFLLSKQDVTGTETSDSYGFIDDLGGSEARSCKTTTYAKAMGSYSDTGAGYAGNCDWWLRSQGRSGGYTAYVGSNGGIDSSGIVFTSPIHAVRPAIHIDLSSGLWKTAGTETSIVHVEGISQEKSEVTIKYGEKQQLFVNYTPKNPTNKGINWTSADADTATVNTNNGFITAKRTGSVKITATSVDGGYKSVCDVTVVKADPKIPADLTASCQDRLSDVALPEGFKWKDDTLQIGGKDTFKASYTPSEADKDNYNAKDEVDIKISVTHQWEDDYTVDKAATCTEEGSKSIHCAACDAVKDSTVIPATGHDSETTVTPATLSEDGAVVEKCRNCSEILSETAISRPATFKLSAASYTYDGSVKKPSVKVSDGNGKTLEVGSDYTVKYPSGRKNVGKYTVKITFKGNYSGSKSLRFRINPKGTSISGLTGAKKGMTVKWKKQSAQTTGYQVMYAVDSKFTSGKKTVTVSSSKTTSKKITKLKAKKKYYVRVRTYKTVSGTKYYSDWSKPKNVKTK